MIFVLVLGLAGPFIMKGPDGRPLMELDDLIPDFSSMKRKASGVLSDVNDTVGALSGDNGGEPSEFGKTRVYRWKDEKGRWQYSDTPPASQESEKLLINPDVNIVQATELPEAPEPEEEKETDAKDSGIGLPLPMTVSPGEARQLIDDAKGIGELMQQRTEALNAINGD